jgi:hypothetical protein
MTQFVRPKGINFSCSEELSAATLSRALCKTASFIQHLDPYAELERYDDWWEHDGLHFHRESINVERLFDIAKSSKSLLEAMPGDHEVFIGIAPKDNAWYLRFYVDWDENEVNLVGRFDVTLPPALVNQYKAEVIDELSLKMGETDSEEYYQSIGS